MNDAWSADENGPSDGASALDAAEAQPFALAEIARQPDRTTSAATPDALSALSRMRRWQENGASGTRLSATTLQPLHPYSEQKTQGKRPPLTQRNKKPTKAGTFRPPAAC